MLFICLECLRRKDCNAALLHVKSGLNIIARFRSQRRLGPPLASLVYTTSDGMGIAEGIHASLYNWIVYKQGSKARERRKRGVLFEDLYDLLSHDRYCPRLV